MWSPIVVATAPVAEPMTLAQAKAHLRVDDDSQDALIGDHIKTARAHIERLTGLRLYTQTLTLRCSEWADLAHLPVAPIQSLTVTYTDTAGATQTLSAAVYEDRLYGLEPGLALKFNQAWPDIRLGSLITVVAVAGFGNADAQEPAILQAMRLLIGDFFSFRETASETATSAIQTAGSVEALLANHRFHLI
jgi:uncharacterized phiE125 gp8 family phage protein